MLIHLSVFKFGLDTTIRMLLNNISLLCWVVWGEAVMIIERELEFRGSKGRRNLLALFDSGATYSCINSSDVDGLANRERLPDPLDVETASDGNFIRIVDRVGLDFYVDGLRMTDEFMVVPNLSESVIIGATTMQKWKIKLDFEHDTIILDPRVAKLKLV